MLALASPLISLPIGEKIVALELPLFFCLRCAQRITQSGFDPVRAPPMQCSVACCFMDRPFPFRSVRATPDPVSSPFEPPTPAHTPPATNINAHSFIQLSIPISPTLTLSSTLHALSSRNHSPAYNLPLLDSTALSRNTAPIAQQIHTICMTNNWS
jgi:hypothetical protein